MSQQELANSIMHRFLTLMRYRQHIASRIQKETNASGRQLAVLRFLAEHSPSSVGEISAFLYVRDGTTSPLLDRMERDGLVTRHRCTQDARRVLVEPTALGRELAASAPLSPVALLRARLPELPADELEQLDRALARLSEIAEVDESILE
ncbi:MAG: winged helix-turn-helix transcriptional regulator [Chloroflexi bacterium]|nr:winged helix-turn-helix transcriptional regulator [Chloroflexota bacterium]